MLRKLFLTVMVAVNFVWAMPVFAQEQFNLRPEINPICWKKAECKKIRFQASGGTQTLGSNSGEEGFVSEPPCVGGEGEEQWGMCFPMGVAKTEISFGGVNTFANLGDFIVQNYKFAIGVASILAVIVIIMSGFQWTMSGGNGEVISSAKHRIIGAITGLFIAYGSYFILNTINPNLVNLWQPKTYMVRPFSDISLFCSQIKVKTEDWGKSMFLEAAKADAQTLDGKVTTIKMPSPFSPTLSFENISPGNDQSLSNNCGFRYHVENGGDTTCFGSLCPGGQSCVNIHFANLKDRRYSCEPYSMVGSVVNSNPFPTSGTEGCVTKLLVGSKNFQFPYISKSDGLNGLYSVCAAKNGGFFLGMKSAGLSSVEPDPDVTSRQVFALEKAGAFSQDCALGDNVGTFVGYGLVLEINTTCSFSTLKLFGKGGTGLASVDGVQIITNSGISTNNLFTEEEIKSGVALYIDLFNSN